MIDKVQNPSDPRIRKKIYKQYSRTLSEIQDKEI
jgi:hypothetical protein